MGTNNYLYYSKEGLKKEWERERPTSIFKKVKEGCQLLYELAIFQYPENDVIGKKIGQLDRTADKNVTCFKM